MNNYKVTRLEDVKAGLERLGLLAEVGNTKAPEWKRIYIHVPNYKRGEDGKMITLYIGRMSFHHGILNSWKMFSMPDYWCYAINLMLKCAIILSPITYYVIGVKAYNETLHLKEAAEKAKTKKSKMLQTFYTEKVRTFTRLFKERFPGMNYVS